MDIVVSGGARGGRGGLPPKISFIGHLYWHKKKRVWHKKKQKKNFLKHQIICPLHLFYCFCKLLFCTTFDTYFTFFFLIFIIIFTIDDIFYSILLLSDGKDIINFLIYILQIDILSIIKKIYKHLFIILFK